MKYLLFGGAQDTGKTSSINRLATLLTSGAYKSFRIVTGTGTIPAVSTVDFKIIIEGKDNTGKDVRILINSATDNRKKINELKSFYDNNLPIDIIISSIRDVHSPRTYFEHKLNISSKDFIIEIPLAKVRSGKHRGSAMIWYEKSLDNLAQYILEQNPFNL